MLFAVAVAVVVVVVVVVVGEAVMSVGEPAVGADNLASWSRRCPKVR